ncbi:Holliday junction resolvase RecU [Mycoplasmatota bacterium WC44]
MINYPIKKMVNKTVSYRNRGMTLEDDINASNEYYLAHNKAIIHKKPIPVKVVSVNYPNRQSAVIDRAFYVTPSTTDYNGVYNGKYIDFEAKETSNKTSFPLTNIHSHQIEHLVNVMNHGGISFILVRFTKLDEIYLLETKYLKKFNIRSLEGRKSIKLDEFREFGHLIPNSYNPRIDYLKVINEIIN